MKPQKKRWRECSKTKGEIRLIQKQKRQRDRKKKRPAENVGVWRGRRRDPGLCRRTVYRVVIRPGLQSPAEPPISQRLSGQLFWKKCAAQKSLFRLQKARQCRYTRKCRRVKARAESRTETEDETESESEKILGSGTAAEQETSAESETTAEAGDRIRE